MQPDTNICNLALGHLKITDLLTNVLTESSVAAQQFRLHWSPVLKEVLRAYPWRFATKRWLLGGPSDTDKPLFEWEYAYKLPQECMRIITVFGADQMPMTADGAWEKEGDCILTNEEAPLYLKGVGLVTNSNKFDASFVNALSFRLAAQVAPGVGESKLQNGMMEVYTGLIASGQSIDSSEAAPPSRQSGGWVSAYQG
ncbi:hypothetical protein [Pseudodesulfovibrio sediminis]|uniref:Uncharacterized protein n=1 Tax=Pseudodesulfovibrio sediminis TaxID=2810563 RepID=A0ABM7P3B5_9BACT|nr:hypothetical protein [Pseudodesulfovibrio sediminis]BCS87331.1 hypothetical protein PSDVSF_05730 [Pseudodesulfovibrio sediminis]